MNRKGFTLVELSIVLVIIGLLIGGILVAQSMVDTARVVRFVKDVQQYEVMAKQFKHTYKYWPGDLPNAYSILGSGCGTNTTALGTGCNGDGGGFIGGLGSYYESSLFWVHLSYSGMAADANLRYSKTNPQISLQPGVAGPGWKDHGNIVMWPSSFWYQIYQTPVNTNLMVFGAIPDSIAATAKPLISVRDAIAADGKMDDGDPARGIFMAAQPSAGNCVTLGSWNMNAKYSPTSTLGCLVYIANISTEDDISTAR